MIKSIVLKVDFKNKQLISKTTYTYPDDYLSPDEATQIFWKLENDLYKIADKLGYTIEELVESVNRLPKPYNEIVGQILDDQHDLLNYMDRDGESA